MNNKIHTIYQNECSSSSWSSLPILSPIFLISGLSHSKRLVELIKLWTAFFLQLWIQTKNIRNNWSGAVLPSYSESNIKTLYTRNSNTVPTYKIHYQNNGKHLEKMKSIHASVFSVPWLLMLKLLKKDKVYPAAPVWLWKH